MRKLCSELKSLSGRCILRIMGWRFEPIPSSLGSKYVLIAFPHNSNMDALYGTCYGLANKIRTHSFIKKEWIFWPMSWLFKAIGTIAVDRSNPHNLVDMVVDEFRRRAQFRLVIFPEGTRKKVKKIKTGFWHIANKANVPIVLVFKDQVSKKLMVLDSFLPSGSLTDDFKRIEETYKRVNFTDIDFHASTK